MEGLTFRRKLRRKSSRGEKILWICLRDRRLGGFKFRRQQQIGPYYADFVCLEKKLVVEFDGPQHELQVSYDHRRDQWFYSEGYRVLRITHDEFFSNEGRALQIILSALMEGAGRNPSPRPSPPRGEGGKT